MLAIFGQPHNGTSFAGQNPRDSDPVLEVEKARLVFTTQLSGHNTTSGFLQTGDLRFARGTFRCLDFQPEPID